MRSEHKFFATPHYLLHSARARRTITSKFLFLPQHFHAREEEKEGDEEADEEGRSQADEDEEGQEEEQALISAFSLKAILRKGIAFFMKNYTMVMNTHTDPPMIKLLFSFARSSDSSSTARSSSSRRERVDARRGSRADSPTIRRIVQMAEMREDHA